MPSTGMERSYRRLLSGVSACLPQGLDRVRRLGCAAQGRGDSTDRGERTAPGASVYKARAPKRIMWGRPSFSLVAACLVICRRIIRIAGQA